MRNFFQEIPFLTNKNISLIKGGNDHTIAISHDGKAYSFGKSDYCGHNIQNEKISTPKEILYFTENNIKIVDVQVARYHTILKDNMENIYTFGNNLYGKLGLGDEFNNFENVLTPIRIEFISNKIKQNKDFKILQISTYNDHSLILTNEIDFDLELFLFILFLSLIFILIVIVILIALILFIRIMVVKRRKKNRRDIFQSIQNEEDENLMLLKSNNNTFDIEINEDEVQFERTKLGDKIIIGQGSSCSVYLGVYKNNYIALKYIKNEAYKKLLLTEINILKNVDHKNIIKYYGILQLNNEEYQDSDESFYILIEYAKYGTLFDIIHQKSKKLQIKYNKKLSIREKFILLSKIVDGMLYLHSKNPPIIHRDLKTENILLDSNMEPKISDFGIAKYKLYTLNTTIGYKGSPIYQAPEQFPLSNGKASIDTSSDVYAFGNIVYESKYLTKISCNWKSAMVN
jgi:hypothetical protein